MEISSEIKEKANGIRMLVMDCDGVLTDGRLYYGSEGEAFKAFHVHDGQGIVSLRAAGIVIAIVTARSSTILSNRAKELGVDFLIQNSKAKDESINELCETTSIDLLETAYIGDDLADIPAMKIVGLPIAVANAVSETKDAAILQTSKSGGLGAVREVADILLKISSK